VKVNNRIRETRVEIRRLSPTEAEVWVLAELDWVTPGTELRGRLVGPQCPGVTTVEIPYPFRRPQRSDVHSDKTLAVHVLIPEPSVWTEQTPFAYQGPLELWQDGERCDAITVSVGLKFAS
jgi:hypothetical protein